MTSLPFSTVPGNRSYRYIACSVKLVVRGSLLQLHKVRDILNDAPLQQLIITPTTETPTIQFIPVARGGSRGSVEPPFRVTGSKYFSHTPHITSGIIVICSIVLNLNLNYLLFRPSLSPSDLINIQLLGYKISLSCRHE